MAESLLLVDYENVQELPLSRLPKGWMVKVFVGRSQNSIPFQLAREAQQLGDRLEWIKIEGDSRNNLDFHLAYYIGRYVERLPSGTFAILSKDKGFDALVAHLAAQKVVAKRIEKVEDLIAAPKAQMDANVAHACELLAKIPTANRPKRRASLVALLTSGSTRKWPVEEVDRIVKVLLQTGVIGEDGKSLIYRITPAVAGGGSNPAQNVASKRAPAPTPQETSPAAQAPPKLSAAGVTAKGAPKASAKKTATAQAELPLKS